MKLLLQHKILFGYLICIVVIGSMVAILLHERSRVLQIETEMKHLHHVQHNVNTAHRYITLLAMHGETALAWEEDDYTSYCSLRLRVDSILQSMHKENVEFVSKEQIDSLRHMLASKEEHLYQIMQAFRRQENYNDLPLKSLPKEFQSKTIIRKKKGLAGFLGAKETVKITPSESSVLQSLNKKILSFQREHQESIDTNIDSLRKHNKELNKELRTLITSMDEQTKCILQEKEHNLQKSYDQSTLIITWLVSSALFMLAISYLIIQRDLREKTRTKIQLEETIKQNTALLNMRKSIILTLSHDIKTPLSIITGNLELAMKTEEEMQRNIFLKHIGDECLHVVHLLNNLLDVYHLNEANEKRRDVPFNLQEMLERTAAGFSHIANDKGIRFVSDFKDTEVRLYGDAVRIEQIMHNLLANAVKFTESGTISFHVRYHNGILTLEIKDTGIGMTEETLSRIFRPFERKDSAANADGHGLGLSITQGLVKLLDGNIRVTSSIEQGSTFRVTLPLRQTDEPVENEEPVELHLEHLPHRVLIIDDNIMQRDVIKQMLERNGIACTACASVKEVVKAMRDMDYDVLLSDIQMPGTDGFELLALLRGSTIGNSRTIPIVAMTARSDYGKKDYQEAGFAACIYKPFFLSDLLGLLSTIKTCRKDENRKVDFSTMLAEVDDKAKLLGSFIEQSRQDADELASAMHGNDRKRLREIAHRMQPMWELLQMEDTLSAYRSLLKDSTTGDDTVWEYTKRIMEYTAKLIAEAKNEIKKLENETENTDS